MKRVFQSSDYYSAQLLKAYLLDNGIEATVTGEMLIGAIGEIPANSYPSLWVVDDDDYDKAKALIDSYESDLSTAENEHTHWTCPQCSELIETQFSQCWSCGKLRD